MSPPGLPREMRIAHHCPARRAGISTKGGGWRPRPAGYCLPPNRIRIESRCDEQPSRRQGRVHHRCGAGAGTQHTQCGWRRKAPTSSRSTFASRSSPTWYPLASPEDLDETANAVKDLGRRIVALKADVRERDQLRTAVEAGMSEFGHLDIVVANAGILPMGPDGTEPSGFVDASDVDLLGAMNTVAVSLPHLSDGSSIIVTGSTAAMMPNTTAGPSMGSGGAGYSWSKRTLVGYVEQMSVYLAPRFIRVNAIHPTNVNTHLLHNDEMYKSSGRTSNIPPAKTRSRRSPISRRCPFRISSPRTSPTWPCSSPATNLGTSPVSRSGSTPARCSSSPKVRPVRRTSTGQRRRERRCKASQ